MSKRVGKLTKEVSGVKNVGIISCKTGLLEEGIAHYQKVIALKPDLSETYYNLGKALKQQGSFEEAIAHGCIPMQAQIAK